MKLSVITVAYNSIATIADTLHSVATQTHPDIQYIVIDGGSTDGTLAFLREHGAHVAKLVSEPDRGIYDAMNKGLALATGDLVGFLNADDMLAGPQTLASIAHAAAGGADAVFGDLVYVEQAHTDVVVRYWRAGEFNRAKLAYGWMPPHPTFYVRRSRVNQLGGFNASLRIAADYEFMLRCLAQPGFKAQYLREVLVRMRIGGASNKSLKAMLLKSREDLFALRCNRVGGWFSLACKNARKLPQFLARPSPRP